MQNPSLSGLGHCLECVPVQTGEELYMSTDGSKKAPRLSDIQALQREFDLTRGFEFHEFLERIQSTSLLPGTPELNPLSSWLLLFTCTALAGETGELANAVKKAIRATMLNQSSELHLIKARSELADVLAYLLKMTNILGDDLETRYLEVVCQNALRFPVQDQTGGVVLSLAGPSGSGKTTIARHLCKLDHNAAVYIEEFKRNPFLPEVKRGAGSQVVFSSQEWFLAQQATFLLGLPKMQAAILDQDPAGIVLGYSRMFRDGERLTLPNYQACLWDLAQLEIQMGKSARRRKIVYLDADPKTLWTRIKKRDGNTTPALSWFKDAT